MDFRTATTEEGFVAIMGEGEIIDGDFEKFVLIAKKASVYEKTGFRILSLNSPGGSIYEAIRIAEVIDEMRFQVIIRPGAICASACGSILFIAADARAVLPGARLGMHSCHDALTKQQDKKCNDMVANFAVSQGIPYGTIAQYMSYVPPEKMVWISDKMAECWGLNRNPGHEENKFPPCLHHVMECTFSKEGDVFNEDEEEVVRCLSLKYVEWSMGN